MKTLVYVSGGKGGIGKTLMALSLTDYFAGSGSVLLVDGDPNNSDSYPTYKPNENGVNQVANVTAITSLIRSEDADGQIDTTGIARVFEDSFVDSHDTVIIDAPAGDSKLIATAGSFIVDMCKEMGAKSIFVWLVDIADRTPINTVLDSWKEIKAADAFYLVKNHSKGSVFEFFDNHAEMNALVANSPNIKIINFPKMAVRLISCIKVDRMNWERLATDKTTPIGARMEGQRVRRLIHESFKSSGL